MTEEEWQHLHENLETTALLSAGVLKGRQMVIVSERSDSQPLSISKKKFVPLLAS